MSDETTLLPCPFCGGEASKRLFYKGKYRVHCNVCDAHSGDVCNTEAEAIATWNHRTAVTDEQFARAVHDGHLWGKCSECYERKGFYLDAETIHNQQEHIAQLEQAVAYWQRMYEQQMLEEKMRLVEENDIMNEPDDE